jgi:hypothetical protein
MTTTNETNEPTNFVNMVEPGHIITIDQQRRPLETSEITTATTALNDSNNYVCFPDSQQEAIAAKESFWCKSIIYFAI